MPLPDIDFFKIRLHRGSQDNAFEELCCQLAALEPLPLGAKHYRKGPGADAGVECFTIRADGSEVGWQVKFYKRMDASLASSLDDSIETALTKHPKLVEYVVCVPFDLSDGRKEDQETALDRWKAWRSKWIKRYADAGRPIQITLWSASSLKRLLATDDPARAGRVLFWFDTQMLTPAWFRSKFERTKADLGRRYTAETNIELPIRRVILGMARDPFLTEQAEEWLVELRRKTRPILAGTGTEEVTPGLAVPVNAVMEAFSQIPSGPDAYYPVADWIRLVDEARERVLSEVERLWSQKGTSAETGSSRQALQKLLELLSGIRTELATETWSLANAARLLVHGDAGRGKSHLLADACAYEVERGRPALLLLGSKFNDGEPWGQVIRELDLPSHVQTKTFLGALDAAAQAAGARALVLIDALNERNGPDIWPARLAGFLHDAGTFPHIVVVVSCRTTYLSTVIPDSLSAETLPRIEHQGFDAFDARAYLMARGIVLPSHPYPAEEFRNPLFLKSCCDSFEKQGLQAFPRGMNGVTAIFDLYSEAVTQAINLRLKLSPGRKYVERTLKVLTDWMANAGQGEVSRNQAYELIATIYPSDGTQERDLLFQLESEGVIASEPILNEDDSLGEVLRFTFERFSDHVIARRILEESTGSRDIRRAFEDDTPFRRVMTRDDLMIGPGVLEALAVQLPEQYAVEITAFTVDPWRRMFIEEAFKASLLTRNQSSFTENTFRSVEQINDADLILNILIAVATEPENRYNARFLHDCLMAQTMPERDADWSIHVAVAGDIASGHIGTLIDWALEAGDDVIDEERAELATIAITWFLTTTSRTVRDRATKALVSIMATRPEVARSALHRFATTDDLYLVERVAAAVYGAALQGKWADEALRQVAMEASSAFFKDEPPANALLRDHARSIIEYAAVRGCLPANFDLARTQPPFHSAWPIEHVSDDTIAGYTRTYGTGYVGSDEIVASCVEDGDFARYVLDYTVADFSPALRGTAPLPTVQDLRGQWLADFRAVATPEMQAAYDSLASTLERVKPTLTRHDPEAISDAKEAFRSAVGEALYEDYRARAENWRARGMYQSWAAPGPASFNLAWARRWVCKRAHDLGWSKHLHGEFDMHQGSGRYQHRIERIGKKYQWLALYELRARMEDNLAPLNEDTARMINAGVEDRLRNIDPSLLVRNTHNVRWGQPSRTTFWIPRIPRDSGLSPREALIWRNSEQDRLDGPEFIDLLDPATGRRWLSLHGFQLWQMSSRPGRSPSGIVRETWCRITAVVVRREDENSLLEALTDRTLVDPHSLPTEDRGSAGYLGEYPWRQDEATDTEWDSSWGAVWSEDRGWHEAGVPVRATTVEYRCEMGDYDCSIDETITLRLPARWLLQGLGLRLVDGRKLAFADTSGIIRFFDPSTQACGTSAALVDREKFQAFLNREELAAVWVVAGEKNLYSEPVGKGFGGRTAFASIYNFAGGQLERKRHHIELFEPSPKQLAELIRKV